MPKSSRDTALLVLHLVVALATLVWLVLQGLVLAAAWSAGQRGGGLFAIVGLAALTAACLGLLVAGAVSLWRGGSWRRALLLAYSVLGIATALYVYAVDPRALLTTTLLVYPLALLVLLARLKR